MVYWCPRYKSNLIMMDYLTSYNTAQSISWQSLEPRSSSLECRYSRSSKVSSLQDRVSRFEYRVEKNKELMHPSPRAIPWQWEFDQKWGPPGGAIDFCVKKSVSARKPDDFAFLRFIKSTGFTGHCSCRNHVGFSFVVLYSYIVEYAFV